VAKLKRRIYQLELEIVEWDKLNTTHIRMIALLKARENEGLKEVHPFASDGPPPAKDH
jgi:hypothetical protein